MQDQELKIALVTGGRKRVGKAIADHLLLRNHLVIALHSSASQNNSGKLYQIQPNLWGYQSDFLQASVASFKQMWQDIYSEFSRLPDILIHNAAVFQTRRFGEASEIEQKSIFQINLTAALDLTQSWISSLSESSRKNRNIIFIADCSGNLMNPQYFYYNLTKVAILHAAKLLAMELAPWCRVNTISPGTILAFENASPEWYQQAEKNSLLGKIGSPPVINNCLDFILNNDFITGSDFTLDGGRSLL